jgi:hypothetical protein
MQVSGNQSGVPLTPQSFTTSTATAAPQNGTSNANTTKLTMATPQPQSTSGGIVETISTGWGSVMNTLAGLLTPQQTVVQLPPGTSGTVVPVGGGQPGIKPPAGDPPAPTPIRQSLLPANVRTFDQDGKIEYIPSSKKDQKVAVLLRKEHISKNWGIKSMKILSSDGTQVLSTGTQDGVDKSGRPIARFDKAASDLPTGAILVVEFDNGQSRKLDLSDPTTGFTW